MGPGLRQRRLLAPIVQPHIPLWRRPRQPFSPSHVALSQGDSSCTPGRASHTSTASTTPAPGARVCGSGPPESPSATPQKSPAPASALIAAFRSSPTQSLNLSLTGIDSSDNSTSTLAAARAKPFSAAARPLDQPAPDYCDQPSSRTSADDSAHSLPSMSCMLSLSARNVALSQPHQLTPSRSQTGSQGAGHSRPEHFLSPFHPHSHRAHALPPHPQQPRRSFQSQQLHQTYRAGRLTDGSWLGRLRSLERPHAWRPSNMARTSTVPDSMAGRTATTAECGMSLRQALWERDVDVAAIEEFAKQRRQSSLLSRGCRATTGVMRVTGTAVYEEAQYWLFGSRSMLSLRRLCRRLTHNNDWFSGAAPMHVMHSTMCMYHACWACAVRAMLLFGPRGHEEPLQSHSHPSQNGRLRATSCHELSIHGQSCIACWVHPRALTHVHCAVYSLAVILVLPAGCSYTCALCNLLPRGHSCPACWVL